MFESLKKFFADRQSTLISGLSALLIIVVGFLLFSYFSQVNKQTASKQTVTVEETTSSGLLSEATRSSIFDEQKATPSAQPKKEDKAKPTQPAQAGVTRYTVSSGDTLSSIAQRFYGNPDQYPLIVGLKENNITNPNLIHPGNILTVPSQGLAAAPGTTQVAQLPAAGIEVKEQLDTTQTQTPVSNYIVQSGDTLWDLASHFYGTGFEWTKIFEANSDRVGLLPNDPTQHALILPGQSLVIPSS